MVTKEERKAAWDRNIEEIKKRPKTALLTFFISALIWFSLFYVLGYIDQNAKYCDVWYGERHQGDYVFKDKEELRSWAGEPDDNYVYSFVVSNWNTCSYQEHPEGTNTTDYFVGKPTDQVCGLSNTGRDGHSSIKWIICEYNLTRFKEERL